MKTRMLEKMTIIGFLILIVISVIGCVAEKTAEAADFTSPDRTSADAASVARWEGLGEHFGFVARSDIEQGNTASVARWEGLGEQHFGLVTRSDIKQGNAASVARWEGLGEHFS